MDREDTVQPAGEGDLGLEEQDDDMAATMTGAWKIYGP